MVTIIICIIIFCILMYFDLGISSILDFVGVTIGGSVIGFIIGGLIALALPVSKHVEIYEYDIVTLQDNSQVEGRFYLGSGNVKGKMAYVFYYKDGDFFRMGQADYDVSKVKYLSPSDSTKSPNVTIYQTTPNEDSFINYFAFDIDVYNKSYTIEVPEGTIRNVQNLDAQ